MTLVHDAINLETLAEQLSPDERFEEVVHPEDLFVKEYISDLGFVKLHPLIYLTDGEDDGMHGRLYAFKSDIKSHQQAVNILEEYAGVTHCPFIIPFQIFIKGQWEKSVKPGEMQLSFYTSHTDQVTVLPEFAGPALESLNAVIQQDHLLKTHVIHVVVPNEVPDHGLDDYFEAPYPYVLRTATLKHS
ncbi:MAG: hypothetical protein ABIC95_03255 [archaeon]